MMKRRRDPVQLSLLDHIERAQRADVPPSRACILVNGLIAEHGIKAVIFAVARWLEQNPKIEIDWPRRTGGQS